MNTPRPDPFYNRYNELAALERAYQLPGNGGGMVLIYGRRRLGKTYLLQRFLTTGSDDSNREKPHSYYLAEQTSAVLQRTSLAEQLIQAIPSTGVHVEDIAGSWNALLRYVSAYGRTLEHGRERFGLVLDEFPYLMERNPELPSVLQSWWDREGAHSRVFVVLCGSQLSTMANLGTESKPLYGRFNAGIHQLTPLSYHEVAMFYESSDYSLKEKLMLYGILGGTPRYHALVNSKNPFADEIMNLFLCPMAALENEVDYLLGSEQIRDPSTYNAILNMIAGGATQFNVIQQKVGLEKASLPFYLKTLIELGWITREVSFGDKTGKRALYKINDPFLFFWHRFITPLNSVRRFSDPRDLYNRRVMPYLDEYMGSYIFEDICKQWLQSHCTTTLGIPLKNLQRYWSRDGNLEIDLVGEIEDGSYLFGECKWSVNHPVGLSVYTDLKAKIAMLPEERWRNTHNSIFFSVGGFTDSLRQLVKESEERIILVDGAMLLSGKGRE